MKSGLFVREKKKTYIGQTFAVFAMPSMNFHFHKTHNKSQDNQNYLTIKHIIKHINKVYKMPGRIEIVESKN